MRSELLIVRAVFISLFVGAGLFLKPIHTNSPESDWLISGLVAALLAATIILFETLARRATVKTLIGAAAGSVFGIAGAALIGFLIARQEAIPPEMRSFLTLSMILFMSYIGLIVGAAKGQQFDFAALGGVLKTGLPRPGNPLILDTSVIIDGRIADIAEAGFISGKVIIPQFVLRELQQVADSADSLRRNRGRRGLDVLQKLQKTSLVSVEISEADFPSIREVDLKLIELAIQTPGQIVTNDFNLNKVAKVRNVQVLNINELANALRPAVLPGETMRVVIQREGKEDSQGVAYLDDGTMVVCDNARRMIGKTIDVSVTSVLQTTAGKMIFARFEQEFELHARHNRQHRHSSRTSETR